MDFLLASDWPESYTRSHEDVQRNGPLVEGEETGYDVAKHIRRFMSKSCKQSSVAEMMFAADYPKVGYAKKFLSHAQAEPLRVTFWLLVKSGDIDRTAPSFVDYFSLRQCVPDFDPPKIRE